MINVAIDEQEKNGTRVVCPNVRCARDIDIRDVTVLLGNDRTRITALERIRLAKQPGAKNCPTPNCGHVFIANPSRPRAEQCRQCNQAYCTGCALRHGANISCARAQAQLQDQNLYNEWLRNNTKQCPRCHTAVEKNGGCNHMTCTQCRHEFLWCCLQDYRNGRCICNGAQLRARVMTPEEELRREVEAIEAAVRERENRELADALAAVRQAEQRILEGPAEVRAREAYLATLAAEQIILEQETRTDLEFADRLATSGNDGGAFERYLVNYIQQHNRFPDSMNRAFARQFGHIDEYIVNLDHVAFAQWLGRYPLGNLSQQIINTARVYAIGLLGRYGINGVSAVGRDGVYERGLIATIARGGFNNDFNFNQLFMDGRTRANGPFEHHGAGPHEYLDAMARGVIRPGWGWFMHDNWSVRVFRDSIEDMVAYVNHRRDGARTDWRNFIVAMRQAALRENNPSVGRLSLLVERIDALPIRN